VPISLNGSKIYPNFILNNNDNIWFIESGNNTLAEIQADPLYGLTATPTPTPTPTVAVTPTPLPTNTPTATPKPTPGFGIAAALVALVVIAKKVYR
jgi:PGF-CTERM protein